MKRFVLVDCNNFYASCERVFNPKLIGKPVVVLSSNDACVIARSNEAKKLGIKMGDSAWQHQAFFKQHNVVVHSANFALYGDMSARVMQILTQHARDIEIYSVDEAFLFFAPYDKNQFLTPIDYARYLKKLVYQYTGIPISIGIGPTKTLAKIAIEFAKKSPENQGVFDITEHPQTDQLLAKIPIEDVWGRWTSVRMQIAREINQHRL